LTSPFGVIVQMWLALFPGSLQFEDGFVVSIHMSSVANEVRSKMGHFSLLMPSDSSAYQDKSVPFFITEIVAVASCQNFNERSVGKKGLGVAS
jgi:hypothetical protein